MCFAKNNGREFGDMTWENFTKIVDQLKEIPTIRAVSLNFGGEPLLHPKFEAMLRTIAGNGWRTGFATNATLLTPQISKTIIATQVSQVDIGMDAVGTKLETLRTGTKYQPVKANILTLVRMRDAVGSQLPVVGINCAFTKDHTLNDAMALVSEMSPIVGMIRILPARNEDMTFQRPELFNQDGPENEFCSDPYHYMGILQNGDVVPCCWDLSAKTVMGNVFDTSIIEVFNNSRYASLREASHNRFSRYNTDKTNETVVDAMREKHYQHEDKFERCLNCDVWQKRLITGIGKTRTC
jgi:MoaA/NifB/PqqE/SkfB family radical SAM enzyme